MICCAFLMLSIHYILLYLFLIINLALASKSTFLNKQYLCYRDNDIFLDTCPAYSPVDFSAALFPDPAVISALGKPNMKEKNNLDNSKPLPHDVKETAQLDDSNITEKDDNDNVKTNNESNNINQQSPPDQSEEEEEKPKPFVSFEEWQKKAIQENDKDRRHKRKTAEGGISGAGSTGGLKRQQMVDSIDGGFSDDFGSMFEDLIGGVVGKGKRPNVYDEGEYIAPSKSGQQSDGNKKMQQFAAVRMKSLKERFNYASTDCAATVRKANKQAKGAQSILYESKDQYLLNKCAADKFVIINLCEQIVFDTIVMANFEFFSSTFKDFRVYASSKYPTDDWRLLGQWQARNTRDLQVFKVPDSGFKEYMKIEFLTHYGHEYYCPLSLVRVHGMSMMEYYTTVESQGDDPVIEEEHLWPVEVREQLIQPQFDITNTSESFPIKNDVDEEDIKPMIPPINLDTVAVESSLMPILEASEIDLDTTTESIDKVTPLIREKISSEVDSDHDDSDTSVLDQVTEESTSHSSSSIVDNREILDNTPSSVLASTPSSSIVTSGDETGIGHEENHFIDTFASSLVSPTSKPTHSESPLHVTSSDDDRSFTAVFQTTNNTVQNVSSASSSNTATTSDESRPIISPPPPQKVVPNTYTKGGSTKESIYKTIMKRLNVLEGNMTLSLRYLDEQNKNLNDVLRDMEKKHQEQLIQLIGHLNETASYRIDSMKRRYEQWYEDLKDQTDGDMREMTAKISILAEQLSFERRVSVSQLVIMITLFVFMALSRGTFSTLSPVMAAQQEERKRRASIDQSSTISKETTDILLNKPNSSSVTTATTPIKTAVEEGTAKPPSNPAIQKISETPKKPANPRRHSDNIYHVMGESDNEQVSPATSTITRSRGSSNATRNNNENQANNNTPPPKTVSYESLGIELQSEALQKKLGDILIQQESIQEAPLLSNASHKASLNNLNKQDAGSSSSIKNRKRSSTSPPLIE